MTQEAQGAHRSLLWSVTVAEKTTWGGNINDLLSQLPQTSVPQCKRSKSSPLFSFADVGHIPQNQKPDWSYDDCPRSPLSEAKHSSTEGLEVARTRFVPTHPPVPCRVCRSGCACVPNRLFHYLSIIFPEAALHCVSIFINEKGTPSRELTAQGNCPSS